MFTKQIPTFSTLRPKYRARYIALDPYMTGISRFGLCEGIKEVVFKQANLAHCTENLSIGSVEIPLDTKLRDFINGCYIKIGKDFYIGDSQENYFLYLTEEIVSNIDKNQLIELYSAPVTLSREGDCCKIVFGITKITIDGYEYSITSDTTKDDVIEYYEKINIPCWYKNETLWFAKQGWSDSTSYTNYSEFILDSCFVTVVSKHKIGNGDELLLFNDNIIANCSVTVGNCFEQETYTGYETLCIVTGMDNDYEYAQLKANPAYFSRIIGTGRAKPFIPDICFAKVFGDNTSSLSKGFRLYLDKDTPLNPVFKDMNFIASKETTPEDLWLCNVVYGKVIPNIPELIFQCDSDGLFKINIESNITDKFQFRFNLNYDEGRIAVRDFDGNELYIGNINDTFSCPINNISISISAYALANVNLKSFLYSGTFTSFIDYYFIARQGSNCRMEVNGLHLNPILKSYTELLAVVGKAKAGEGRIAI